MKRKDTKAIVDRQIQGVSQRADKIREGIGAVDISPGARAADNLDKMVQNFLAAVNDGTLEQSLRGVDLEAWKQAALEGVSRIGPGMERKRAIIQQFHDALQEYQLRYTQNIDKMPSLGLEDSRARMNANFDAMSKFKFRK